MRLSGHRDAVTQGQGDTGPAAGGSRGAALALPWPRQTPRLSPCWSSTSGVQHGRAGTALLPHGGDRRFLPAPRQVPREAAGPPLPPTAGPQHGGLPANPQEWGVILSAGTVWHGSAHRGWNRSEQLSRPSCHRCHHPQRGTLPEKRVCPSGQSGDLASQVADAKEERWRCREAEAELLKPREEPQRLGLTVCPGGGPSRALCGDPRVPSVCGGDW